MKLGTQHKSVYLAGVMTAALLDACLATPAAAQAVSTDSSASAPTAASEARAPADAPADQAEPAAAVPATAGPAAEAEDAPIVVTGSRVTNGNNSPTPMTVVSADELLTLQPSSIAQGLSTLPGLLGSIGTTSNVNTGGYNIVNLRGVGLTRGLILFNGRRVGPTQGSTGSQAGTTNIDVVPQMLLKRVDVVTGGASAVYGSDAISGVVNFVTDTRFNGLKVSASNGISTYGDDRKSNIGAAWGTPFAGNRGHFEVSYEYRNNAGFSRAQRDYFDPIYTEQGSVVGGGSPGTAANPFILTTGAHLSTASFGGLIVSGPFNGLRFEPSGTLTPFVHGAASGTTGVEYGGDGAVYRYSSLVSSQQFHQGYSRLDYDLASNVKAHVEGAYTNLKQSITQQTILLNRLSIGYNNAFLSTLQPQYASVISAGLASAPAGTIPSFLISEMNLSLPPNQLVAKQEYWMVDAGLDGSLGKSFSWNIDYYHTDSSLNLTNPHNLSNARLAAALNAVRDSSGRVVCNAALANPTVYGGCVPLNIFGAGATSQAAIDYVTQSTSQTQTYVQDAVSATIKGEPFALPAGPVAVAINGEWRRQSLQVGSNAAPTDAVVCTGIQFNCAATTAPYFAGAALPLPRVSQDVAEAAIEANIPILADKTFFKELSLNAAGRYTHYTTSGNVVTWKLGGVWKPANAVTFRVTRSRDIRAPSLLDLFAPVTLAASQYVDLHTNTPGIVNRLSQGNSDLKPEKADTLTAGVVFRPDFAPGLSFSVDYYHITVNQAIVQNDPFQTTTQAACEASAGASSICALYVRPLPFSNRTAANYPTLLINKSLNIASIRTHGVDFEMNYRHDVGGHVLALRGLVNWQPKLTFDNGPSGVLQVAGSADGLPGIPPVAKLKIVASAAYDIADKINLRVQERWRGSLRQNASPLLFFADDKVPSVGYTDMNITFDVSANASVSFNVQNLFNTTPPPFSSSGGSTQPNYLGGFAQGDDIEGRLFTASVRLKF